MGTRSKSIPPSTKVFSKPHKKPASAARSGVHPALFYGCFALLFATNVVTLIGFLMAPDISAMLTGKNDEVFAAYEDRIAQLRVEVDRLHSRNFAQTGDINLQLQELSQQQEVLLEQHQLVKQLADKAAELGIHATDLPSDTGDDDVIAPIAASASAASKDDLAQVSSSMTQMMDDGRMALAALSESATRSTDEILGELRGLGIKPNIPDELDDDAMGGPYIPATVDAADSSSIVDDANEVYLALARFKAARSAIDLAPIHQPMATLTRVSSGYGNRKDPFTGGRAFHAGIDFPAPRGTLVLSAGYGKVSFVGQRSGYGNVVEVTHSTGLVTRYGHLSAFLVKEGQLVSTGTPIAKVGSTGRSTGPHLHFEVRVKDAAVDPNRYLAAGRRLVQFLGS